MTAADASVVASHARFLHDEYHDQVPPAVAHFLRAMQEARPPLALRNQGECAYCRCAVDLDDLQPDVAGRMACSTCTVKCRECGQRWPTEDCERGVCIDCKYELGREHHEAAHAWGRV